MKKGVVALRIPTEEVNYTKLSSKVYQQYALKELAENIILLDSGHAKLMVTSIIHTKSSYSNHILRINLPGVSIIG
ncbi:hypothetical protein CPJCM30710_29650 [Clostridium polyendosporum]|uniref:Uncharacterized protein n=1 Tax=Clostridium polyendosporum TaxID=69208 RepID=A0A919VFH2_9CLOT|nr:hypothetical protein CPJCM30710_29650 [Clostridium polyendosporum]